MTTLAVTRTKAKATAVKGLMISGSILAAVAGFGWAGLRVQPVPFPAIPQPSAPPETMPLPAGLPAPVERFYRVTYGEQVPLIKTAVISGREPCGSLAASPFHRASVSSMMPGAATVTISKQPSSARQ